MYICVYIYRVIKNKTHGFAPSHFPDLYNHQSWRGIAYGPIQPVDSEYPHQTLEPTQNNDSLGLTNRSKTHNTSQSRSCNDSSL